MSSALSAPVVEAIEDLELAARLVVEGLRTGQHRSPFHGFSAEFSQHRPYRAGDDLKYLDWKILARTDRLYTRQFRETTNMAAMIVLDASASMRFPADSAASKIRYATVIAAALAHLIVQQGDAVGLMTTRGSALRYLPAKGGKTHLRALVSELANVEATGTWEPQRLIARGAELLSRRGLLVVISDFYDAEDETARELRRAARHGHDVSMLQMISREELTFPYRGDLDIEDLESGARRTVDAEAIGRSYRTTMADFLERCRKQARQDGRDYGLFPTDVAPGQALRSFLIRRSAGRGGGDLAGDARA